MEFILLETNHAGPAYVGKLERRSIFFGGGFLRVLSVALKKLKTDGAGRGKGVPQSPIPF